MTNFNLKILSIALPFNFGIRFSFLPRTIEFTTHSRTMAKSGRKGPRARAAAKARAHINYSNVGRRRGPSFRPPNPSPDALSQPVKDSGPCPGCEQPREHGSPQGKRRKSSDGVEKSRTITDSRNLSSEQEKVWRTIADASFMKGMLAGQRSRSKRQVKVENVIRKLSRRLCMSERTFRNKMARPRGSVIEAEVWLWSTQDSQL